MKSGGALHTSDKFWSDGRIKPGLGLIWRREETSSEWAPELDIPKSGGGPSETQKCCLLRQHFRRLPMRMNASLQ
ncbi:hypothetical protein [Shouchella shacheensis]|uniref:hypothetical protein n=1 Tax=Shouchella shacheensis TaxID=1649580 RepID=UPI0012F88BBE|nr:hypothetical protein [Shouchella shacheensis]